MTGYLLDRCDDVLRSTESRRDLLVTGLRERRGERFDDGTVARHDESVAMYTGWLKLDRCGLETAEYALVDATTELVFYRGERDEATEEARQAYLALHGAFPRRARRAGRLVADSQPRPQAEPERGPGAGRERRQGRPRGAVQACGAPVGPPASGRLDSFPSRAGAGFGVGT